MVTYEVRFGNQTYTRRSENSYTHASIKRVEFEGFKVAFHTSYSAAQRRAGRFGEVKAVTARPPRFKRGAWRDTQKSYFKSK
jgi:hypothetical protein